MRPDHINTNKVVDYQNCVPYVKGEGEHPIHPTDVKQGS